ncbi:glycosyltransferase [Limnothrix sp. FACHB-881]|uniref:glycosyltransferase n=1 Tax=Limnothrix sp. FACHB-881 TaxID=2692819 RepID=UPI00168A29CC|nr:glycosyltransferase [Limnothrix sp. FACHB-881]MBD2636321.1 glycosyltransferase [Limnothrix sp. FACHB-881]
MIPCDRRYALVHEWLTPLATGGSELVVREMVTQLDRWLPEPVALHALIDFESSNSESYLYGRAIGHTFLQRFPGAIRGVQRYLPLWPLAIEQLDLRAYDIILSSSHAVAKGALVAAHQLHVCYCHAPMRYAWDLTHDYLAGSRSGRGPIGWLTRYLLHRLRLWDVLAANRVDFFAANSRTTANRIWRCYRRRAEVIYPPVQVDRFPLQTTKDDYYLCVTRLVPYKRVDLIVEAFNQLGLPLMVIGGGPMLESLREQAGANVQLLGEQPDAVVAQAMAQARAFVYAAFEDFGIAPVEAQACGTPVIAFAQGGTGETVRDCRQDPKTGTGLLFEQQTSEAIAAAVTVFEDYRSRLSAEAIHRHAQSFSPNVFRDRYFGFVNWCWQEFQRDRQTPTEFFR